MTRKNIAMLLFVFAVFLLTPDFSSAAEKLIDCDFEEGANWNYGDHFDLWGEYLGDEWTIVSSDKHGGNYSAQSRDPNPGGILESSGFHFDISSWYTWGSEIFIRFWAKHPVDFVPEATDENRGCNQFRIGTGLSGDWTSGIEYIANGYQNSTFLHFYYDARSAYGTPPLYVYDGQWHEYAVYLRQPTSDSSANGRWVAWRDANGTYDDSTALYTRDNIAQDLPWSHIYFGNYYKGECSGNWTFWVDDIDVWNGMPGGDSQDTTPPASPSGLNVS